MHADAIESSQGTLQGTATPKIEGNLKYSHYRGIDVKLLTTQHEDYLGWDKAISFLNGPKTLLTEPRVVNRLQIVHHVHGVTGTTSS